MILWLCSIGQVKHWSGQIKYAYSTVRLGNIVKHVESPKSTWLVPFNKSMDKSSQTTLQHLRWLLQKDKVNQDVFLIGNPGPSRRQLALLYCELAEREFEHLVLSRDTTEGDVKQRKEIISGSSVHLPGPAVRAACEGRVLILEGVERAEQNLLPILNNLLENREMHLEDGRFLVSPKRFDTLHNPSSDLLRVNENFWVIALGIPAPPYKGYPLDPPLRSRFQARIIDDIPFQEHKEKLIKEYTAVNKDKIHSLLSFAAFLKQDTTQNLPFLSSTNIDNLIKILDVVPSVSSYQLLKKVYPYTCLLHRDTHKEFRDALQKINIPILGGESALCEVLTISGSRAQVSVNSHHFTVPAGDESVWLSKSSEYQRTTSQEQLMSDMILSHTVGDICLIGPSGCGKSVAIKEFGRRLGYEVDTVVAYSDMTTRDLLQRRHTDINGNSTWENAPLITGALEGKLVVLDSINKLHHTVIAALASLCEDRHLDLPNGTRLVSAETHKHMCLKLDMSEEQLSGHSVLPIHPSFRIIATADTNSDWITPDLLGLWHFHQHEPLDDKEQLNILLNRCCGTQTRDINLLQKTARMLRTHPDPLISGVGDMLTLRRLIGICHGVANGVSVSNALHTALLTRFMPHLARTTLTSVLEQSGLYQTDKESNVTCHIDYQLDTLTIGEVKMKRLKGDKQLVPSTLFYDNTNQLKVLEDLLRSFKLGEHILLVGNQGVGKNKLVDRLLELLDAPREYLQLHRDSTVQSITVQPTITGGRVEYADSALVRAARNGRVLVIDEADKAPTNVTSVLRTLLDTGSMWLSDGSKIVPHGSRAPSDDKYIECHPEFRVIFLANRPGFPFLGNDFYAVMGDLLSCHSVDNPDPASELALLKSYGPDVTEDVLTKLISAFSELRDMSDAGTFLYPYSTRELVNIVKHIQEYPEDGVTTALSNVLDFEIQRGDTWDTLVGVLHKHGIPFGASPIINTAPRFPLATPKIIGSLSTVPGSQISGKVISGSTRTRGPFFLPHKNIDLPISRDRAKAFNEKLQCRQLPLLQSHTRYTHLLAGENTLHVISSHPETIYTISDTHTTALDISPALRARPHLTAAAHKDMILISDQAAKSLLLANTTDKTIYRVELTRLSYFGAAEARGYKLATGGGSTCWMYSGSMLVQYDFEKQSVKQLELPFKIEHVSDNGQLIVKSPEASYLVTVSDKRFTCTHLDFCSVDSKVPDVGSLDSCWLSDSAAGLQTDIPFVDDVVLRENSGFHCILDKCQGSLANNTPVTIREINTGAGGKRGLLHKGMLVYPVSDIPESYNPEDNPADTSSNISSRSGYLAVADISRNWISFLPLPTVNVSRYDAPEDTLLGLSAADKIVTLSSAGTLQEWELSEESLAVSYKTWRQMVGQPQTQLSIDRTSGLDVSGPKHGKIDPENTPHVGGNTWAGGTGGRDTAGLGGKGGPYRLDAGHTVHQLSDEEKSRVPEEVQKAARDMGRKAFEKRLQEIRMSQYDSDRYQSFVEAVRPQITSLKQLAAGLQAKQGDRVWLKNQADGELDDAKLVEGLMGERGIYKRRSVPQNNSHNMTKPKHVTLLVDVSGSMYRFNGLDQRLQRELEVMAMVMEGLAGSEHRVKYDIIGHSGENPHIDFVSRDRPPENEKLRLQVLEEMHAHSQFCWSGDHTVSALDKAISHAASIDADDRIVVAFSDANLERYFISPSRIASLMTKDPNVAVFMVFIGSLGNEAEKLRKVLPAGKSFVTMDTKDMPNILQQIFSAAMLQ